MACMTTLQFCLGIALGAKVNLLMNYLNQNALGSDQKKTNFVFTLFYLVSGFCQSI